MHTLMSTIRRNDASPDRYPNGYADLRTACRSDTLAALEAAAAIIGKGGIIVFCACRGDELEAVAEQLHMTPGAVNIAAGWMVAQTEQAQRQGRSAS